MHHVEKTGKGSFSAEGGHSLFLHFFQSCLSEDTFLHLSIISFPTALCAITGNTCLCVCVYYCSLQYLQCLKQFLAHGRYSTDIFGRKEERKKGRHSLVDLVLISKQVRYEYCGGDVHVF